MTTYADSGVNRELGDDVSKILYNAARQTWINRKGKLGDVIVPFDDFSGLRFIRVHGLAYGTVMNIGFDGVGTKVTLAQRTKNHETVAYDLLGMVCDDAVVRGAEPVLVGSILDVQSLGPKDAPFIDEVKQLAEGYINAARESGVAIVNGEVAELGSCVDGYGDRIKYNWGAGAVWFANEKRLFSGKEIQVNDYLVGLYEPGFRSNGISLVRKIMEKTHGEKWHEIPWANELTLGTRSLIPSKIYTKLINELTGGWDLYKEPKAIVHGIAHITGGGIPEKLGRALKLSGLGAIIDEPFEPSKFMQYVQTCGKVEDNESYKTWNMGQGMIIITPKPDEVRSVATLHYTDSKIIGKVTSEPGIKIKNRGAFCPEKNPFGVFAKTGPDYLEF